MKRPRKKKRGAKDNYDQYDSEEDDNDNEEQVDEGNIQANYNSRRLSTQAQTKSLDDLLFTNETTVKNELDKEIETIVRGGTSEARPSISVSAEEESRNENEECIKENKPFFSTMPRKKVQFVIELPTANS